MFSYEHNEPCVMNPRDLYYELFYRMHYYRGSDWQQKHDRIEKLMIEQYKGLEHSHIPEHMLEPSAKSVRQSYYSRKYKSKQIYKQKCKVRKFSRSRQILKARKWGRSG